LLVCANRKTVAASVQGEGLATLSEQERSWLEENKDSIVLTYEANFPPLELRAKDGQYVGFSASIIDKIEKLLGVRFRKVPSEDFNAQLASLKSGETHLCAVVVRTPERERYAFFTEPYISLPLVIITSNALHGRVDWEGLGGKRVGVVSGYAVEKYVLEVAQGRFTVVPVGGVREGLRDVSFGVLDAFVENLSSASYYIETDGLTNLRVAGPTDYSYHMSIGVSRSYPLLFSAVQKAMAEIPGEELEASRKQWMYLSSGGELSPEAWRLIKLAGVFTVLLLLGLGAISYYLKRRLNEKVASLHLAQQELLEQTERLGLATEATNAGVWDFYPDTGQVYFSDQWTARLGYEPGVVEATFAGWVGLIHPDDRVTADHALMGYIDTGGEGLFEAEYRIRQADGGYRWVLGKGRAIAWDQNGIPTRLVGLNLDIQKLKSVQEELHQSEALARAIFDQTFQLCALLSTDGLLVNCNRRALAYSGVSLEDAVGIPFWDGPWWPDKQEAERFLRQAMAQAMAGGVARSEVVHVDARGNPTVVDFSLSPLTGADGSVKYFIAEGRDITEMRQAESALKESEEKFRAIFNNAPVGIFRTAYGGQVLEANAALARMHGCESAADYLLWAEDLGKDRYAHPEDRERLLQALLANPSGASLATELRRKDGSTCQGIINAVLQMDEHGAPAFIDGTIEDITERKKAEEALRESEERYRSVIQNMQDVYYRTDAAGRIVMMSPSGLRLYGCASIDEVREMPSEAFYMNPADRQQLLAKIQAEGVARDFELTLRRKDGTPVFTATTSNFYYDAAGNALGVEGILRDITERKRAEEALRESEEKYRAIFNTMPVGIFRTTVEGQLIDANPTMARMVGHPNRQHLLANTRDLGWESYQRAEDRHRLIDALLASPQGVSMELELKRLDGASFHAIVNASLQQDSQGRLSLINGTVEDITERKLLELRLADQLAFQEALLNTIPYPVFYKGADTRFVGFNTAYEEAFGVRREDLIGKRVLELEYLPAEDRETYQFEDEAVIASVGEVQREMPFLYADGAWHQTLYSVTGFRLADGTSGGLIGVIVDITDLKQTEQALLEEKRFTETLLDGLPNIFFLYDSSLRLRRWNRNHETTLGFGAEEMLGRDIGQWFSTEDRRARGIENARKILFEARQGEHENYLLHKDGHEIPYILTGVRLDTPEGPMMMGVGVDITERKQAEEALRQSEEKFSRIFEMAPEWISFVRLRDSMFIDVNAAFVSITGYAKQEAIGRTPPDLKIWDDAARRQEFLRKLQADGIVKDFEFMLRRKDGALRHMRAAAQVVDIFDEPSIVGVFHDITDERRIQELLIQSEKMMSVGSLAAGIAHEINNPLGIVHQAVQNLILRTNPEQKKNLETADSLGLDMDKLQAYLKVRKLDVFLQDIQAAALRASGIIRNMLNFSRRSESTRQACDLPRIIEQSVFLASSDYDLKKAFDFKRIEIVQDLETELPGCRCTETEIEQVLLNLLRNAAQAMAMASPPTQAPKIEIRLRAGENCVRIEVADNGPGMDQETQRKALEPFFTTKPPGVGTGLGLSVSYFIITKGHGGRMWLTSAPGRGTTFFIELPTDEEEANDV